MSNRMYIETTKFVGLRTGNIFFGVRVYDDYDSVDNDSLFETEKDIPDDDLVLLKMVMDIDDEKLEAMFNYVQENKKCIYIDNNIYEWEQIKHLWDEQE